MAQGSPKVSICIVTYNQEKFVTKCVQSILSQKVNFDYEIIIADDKSTDGTSKILDSFALKYPDIIKYVSHEKNIGPFQNFVFAHKSANGKYVAHIDGDDYALPGKLQAQVDYLDQNPNCNIVWHRMNSISQNGDSMYEDNYAQNGVVYKKLDIVDLISNITIGFNSSKMYRRDYEYRDWTDYYELDFPFNVLKLINTEKYASFTSDSVFGIYRSSIGISFTHNYEIKVKIYRWLLRFYKDRLIDRKLLNAKITLLLLSDIKHLKKTAFYGIYAFITTCFNFRIKALFLVKSKQLNLNTRFKAVDKNSML